MCGVARVLILGTMYALLSECWHQVPASRPLFDDIVECVQSSYEFELAHTEKAKLQQQDDYQLFGAQQSAVLREGRGPEIAPFDSEETQGPAAAPSARSSSSGAGGDIETAAADFDQKVDSAFEANSNPSGGAGRGRDHGNRGGGSVSSSDPNAIRPNEPVKRISSGRRWSYFFSNGNGDDKNGGSADASSQPVPADGGGVNGVATANDSITVDSHGGMYCKEFLPPTDTGDISHDNASVIVTRTASVTRVEPQTPNYVPPPPNRMSQHSRAAHADVEQGRSHHHQGQNQLLHSECAQNDHVYGSPQHVAHSGRGSDVDVASGGSRPFTDGDRLEMAGNGPVAHGTNGQQQTVFRRTTPGPGSTSYPSKPAGNSEYGNKVGINLPPGASTVPPRRAFRSSSGGNLLGKADDELMDHVLQHQPTALGSSSTGTGFDTQDSMDGGPGSANYKPPPKKAGESGYGNKVGVNLPPSRGNGGSRGGGGGSSGHGSSIFERGMSSESDDPLAQRWGAGGFEKHDRLTGGQTAQVTREETHEVGGGSMYAVGAMAPMASRQMSSSDHSNAVAGQRAGERTRHGHQKHTPRRRGSTLALLDEDGDPENFEI